MVISECMSREVRTITPDATIQEAAQLMKECDAGIIPVRDGDRLVGMISDRDIAVRAVADGRDAQCLVRDVMTKGIEWVFEDQELSEVAQKMSQAKVRRMPVLSRDKRLTGIVSLGDMAKGANSGQAAQTLANTSQPGGPHNQAQAR